MDLVREAFVSSVRTFDELVGSIGPDDWARPALGVWDVRSLVGHALRGVVTAPDYLVDAPITDPDLPDAGAYLAAALATPALHDSVAERGREGGRALGDDPAGVVHREVERAVAAIEAAGRDAAVATPFGTMLLDAYLPTRVVEVVTHTDDLCRALDRPPVATRDEVRVVLGALATAADATSGIRIVRAVLGREPLEEGFNLWG